MSRQKLVNVLSVTVPGNQQLLVEHGLLSASEGLVPNQITCDRQSPIGVMTCDATHVRFRNLSNEEEVATFRIEHDHSTYSVDTPPLYWQGAIPPVIPDAKFREQNTWQVRTSMGDLGAGVGGYADWRVTVRTSALYATVDSNSFRCEVTEDVALSTPGPLGTLAIRVKPLGRLSPDDGFSLHSLDSITLSTFTTTKTQAKLLVIVDLSDFMDIGSNGRSAQGWTEPRGITYPIAVLRSPNGGQSMTPIVSPAYADGTIPMANGVPYQLKYEPGTLEPQSEKYPCIRVSAAGLTKADADVVTDPAYNKLQSLTIKF